MKPRIHRKNSQVWILTWKSVMSGLVVEHYSYSFEEAVMALEWYYCNGWVLR